MAMKQCPYCPLRSKIRPPLICDKCGDIGEKGHAFMAHYWAHVLIGLVAVAVFLFALAVFLLRAGV